MTNKTWLKWTEEELELLKIHWKSSTSEKLKKIFPNRDYNSLMCKAKQLGVKSEIKRKRKGSLDFLNELTPESCYWWGFIIADGHLSKKGELIITLSSVDKNHLLKLSNLLNTNLRDHDQFTTLRIQDKRFGERWLKTLVIDKPKTYFPPDLSIFLTEERLLPFFIGLVDGDGCIWNSKGSINLRVELHGEWIDTLGLLSSKLKEFYDIDSRINVSKRGFAQLNINAKKNFQILKTAANELDALERKWEKIVYVA